MSSHSALDHAFLRQFRGCTGRGGSAPASRVPGSAIGLIGRQETGDDGAAEGASIGGVAGGVTGLLASLGVIAIPGIGPVVAGGWLASIMTGTAGGALAGGVLGALLEASVTNRDANYYAETVRRGASLVSVRTEGTLATTVAAIMEAARPIDHQSRRADYEREAGPFSTSAPAPTASRHGRT